MNGMFSNNTTAAAAPMNPMNNNSYSRYRDNPIATALQSSVAQAQQNNPTPFSSILGRFYGFQGQPVSAPAPTQPAMQAPQPMQTPQTSPLSSVPYMAFLQNPQFIQYASRNPQLSQLLAVLARKQPSLFNQRIL